MRPFSFLKKFQKGTIKKLNLRANKISDNARGIYAVARQLRSNWLDMAYIPSCATVAPPGQRPEGAIEHDEGLPARVVQKREHRSDSGGRSDFVQLVIYELIELLFKISYNFNENM